MRLRNQNEIMRHENFMASGGYYVAIRILTVWKRLACLAPDQPHTRSFPDAIRGTDIVLGSAGE